MDRPGAVAAAAATASELGLAVDGAFVLHASNRITVRLLPADVVARVATTAHGAGDLEVRLASDLASVDSPVATLDRRIAPAVYEREGFAITFWTYYEARPTRDLSPMAYADALVRLHAGLRRIDLAAPHFTERVEEAAALIASPERTPGLRRADRQLLADTLMSVSRAIVERGIHDQLLHGEPHPGNVLDTASGPLFVDLETACRGPLEFDLAHVPEEVSRRYPGADGNLVAQCRVLVMAMIAAWRFDARDRLPGGRQAGGDLLSALRAGPPYPALSAMSGLD
jgi:Ser/Thr protein kinase RdoA (MazF antagonist)